MSQKRALLSRLQELNATSALAKWKRRYWDDPLGFVTDCLEWRDGEGPTAYQADVLRAVGEHERVAVRGPRGMGKTALGAWLVLWWALTRDGEDWKVLTKASVGDQLRRFLWPEIRLWARRVRWQTVVPHEPLDAHDEMMQMSLRLTTGEASANTSGDVKNFEGAHADHIMVLFDEARAVPDEFWRSALGMFTGTGGRWIAISTPGEESGTFYHIHSRHQGWDDWWTRKVTLSEAVGEGLVTQRWADGQLRALGEADPLYIQQALADFANMGQAGGIVPLSWAEQAQQRWEGWDEAGRPGYVTSIGFDVGGGTEQGDASVVGIIKDHVRVDSLYEYQVAADPSTATMELVGHVVALANQHGRPPIYGDAQGIGAGVVARLIERGYDARPFVASYSTTLTDAAGVYGFGNWRAAAWWLMREALDPQSGQDVMLPPHERLTGDLTAPRIKRIDSSARRFVEAKEDLRKRLGRSPDCADAVLHGIMGPVLELERAQANQVGYRVRESDYRIGQY